MTTKTTAAAADELIEVLVQMGYPAEFGQLLAAQLGTENTITRLTQYLIHVQPSSAEEIADEMLTICEERDKWVEKKKNEYYNQQVNAWLNRDR
jgi:hypothetical protein